MNGLLLDTHTLIWVVQNDPLSDPARTAIKQALVAGQVHVSAVNAWEIGLLAGAGSGRSGVDLHPDAKGWFERAVREARAILLPLSADIAIAASGLPAPFHKDPADRFLVATARALNLALVTRDRAILAYAKAGHVKAIAC